MCEVVGLEYLDAVQAEVGRLEVDWYCGCELGKGEGAIGQQSERVHLQIRYGGRVLDFG